MKTETERGRCRRHAMKVLLRSVLTTLVARFNQFERI